MEQRHKVKSETFVVIVGEREGQMVNVFKQFPFDIRSIALATCCQTSVDGNNVAKQ